MELTVKKKGFAVLFVGVLILSSTIGVVNAYDSPIETWTKKELCPCTYRI